MTFKLCRPRRDTSKFQKPVSHKTLDEPGTFENSCSCAHCLEFSPKYRVKHTEYQRLWPFGLDPPSLPTEESESDDGPDEVDEPESSSNNEQDDGNKNNEPHSDNDEEPHGSKESNSDQPGNVMAPASNEEQFKFLISCIRHSNNGKVDFIDVAKECNIVSEGAAAKRYERLMKFHGIHQSQSAGTTAPTMRDTPVASRRKTSPSREANNKKRKLNKLAENSQPDLNVDDDEGFGKVKTEYSTDIKAEPESIKKEDIKDEPTATEENLDPKACNTYNSAMGFDGAIDSAMFDDFLAFGGSPNHYHGSHAASDDGISKEGSASMSMKPATQNGNGEGLHESILITD